MGACLFGNPSVLSLRVRVLREEHRRYFPSLEMYLGCGKMVHRQ